jgi:hypothetical protein
MTTATWRWLRSNLAKKKDSGVCIWPCEGSGTASRKIRACWRARSGMDMLVDLNKNVKPRIFVRGLLLWLDVCGGCHAAAVRARSTSFDPRCLLGQPPKCPTESGSAVGADVEICHPSHDILRGRIRLLRRTVCRLCGIGSCGVLFLSLREEGFYVLFDFSAEKSDRFS